jgi:dephospho-CoA kinase
MILGITGISGSGKHTAANILARKGWVVLDADSLAHYLYRPYTNVWKAVTREFGERILNQDDSINRAQLGKLVFDASRPEASEKALKKLNGILHPYLQRRLVEEARFNSKKGVPVAVVAALWDELGLKKICEKFLWVEADPALSRERVLKRDGITAQMYALRIKSQIPLPNPDFKVENNGTTEELATKLQAILGL